MTTTPTIWKAQHQLNFTDAADQQGPAVVGIGSGRYVVAWTEAFGTAVAPEPGTDIIGQIYDALGNRVGNEIRLNVAFSGDSESKPQLAKTPDGGFLVVYEDFEAGITSLRMQRFDVNGSVVSGFPTTIRVGSAVGGSYHDASVAVRSNGSFLVSFENQGHLVVERFTAAGNSTHFRGATLDPARDGEVVALSDGAFAIAHRRPSSSPAGIYSTFVEPVDPAFNFGGPGHMVGTEASDADPQIAALKGGGYVVVYVRQSGGTAGEDIQARVFNNAGTPVSAIFTVNAANVDGDQNSPDVAALEDGGFVVIWHHHPTNDLRAQRFDASGSTIGVEFLAASGVEQQVPVVSTLPDGRFMVAFQRPFGDHDVYGTIFDPRDSSYNGTPGNDVITARLDGATINALGGNDQLLGQGGPDRFTGGAGNDTLGGAGGADVAVYAGARANYQVHTFKAPGGVVTRVKDGVGTEGNDFLTGIETLIFAGANLTRFGAQSNLTANVDGARFDDVLFRKVSNGQVIFQNMTNGAATGFDAITAPLTSTWRAIGMGDATADAKADVFIWNSANGQVLTASPGASGAPTYAVIANGISGNFAAVGTGDLDGDGFTDLVVRDGASGAITWRPMTGGSPDTFKPVGTFGSSWTFQGTGDVNRDGFADVVIRSSAAQVVVVNMANGTQSGFIDLGNVPGFRIGAIADVNADGFDDIVFQNEANGQVLWRNLSGIGAQWNVATDPLGTGYRLRRGADVDNDGSADLIVQHATTGETLYRAMDAGVGTGWVTVSSPLGSDWVVV